MAIFLSFVICTAAASDCHIVIPYEEPFVGLSACQQAGMMMIPEWQRQHSGWMVTRVRCTIGDRPKGERLSESQSYRAF
jgi:hypothetical protein